MVINFKHKYSVIQIPSRDGQNKFTHIPVHIVGIAEKMNAFNNLKT